MTEHEAKDRASAMARMIPCYCVRGQPCTCHKSDVVSEICGELVLAYDDGVKAGEAKGGYRAGFEAGQASANKTISELQAQVAALKATVDQCRAAWFIDDAGNVRKVVGTLTLTADDMIAGAGCELWADFNAFGMDAPLQCLGPCLPCIPMTRLYGSREAAKAAAARKAVKP